MERKKCDKNVCHLICCCKFPIRDIDDIESETEVSNKRTLLPKE